MPIPSDEATTLRHVALGHLARREHSRQELQRKLSAQFPDASPAALATVLEALAQDGYQSDNRFAESYVRFRAAKGFGPMRLQRELRERGVEAELISAALDTFEAADSSWAERCARVRASKFGQPPANRLAEAKQARYLLYRGFSSDQVRSALASQSDSDDAI